MFSDKKDKQDALVRELTQREEEEVRTVLVKERARGSAKSVDDIAEALSTSMPNVSPAVLHRIEREPGFVKSLFKDHQARVAHRMGEVIDTMIDMAVSGDVKAMRLYFDIQDMGSKKVDIKTGVQNNFQLSGLSTDQLKAQFTEYSDAV